MKKQIHIYMIHRSINCIADLTRYIRWTPPDEYELVWDTDNPDYLVVSEHIYLYRREWDLYEKYKDKSKVFIFFAGECIYADMNMFDYAVVFDRDLRIRDRIKRIPTRYFFEPYIARKNNRLKSVDEALRLVKNRSFCDFIYSNARGHEKRKELFDMLSAYKRVDSYGGYLNNRKDVDRKAVGLEELIRESVSLKRKHKFSIACENAKYCGYTSEKVLTSLAAHAIPVYWGNPEITRDINPNAIINCMEYDNINDVIDVIKEIDNDDYKWASMVAQPWLTKEQQKNEKKEIKEYNEFIEHIFAQDIKDAVRRGEGFHPDNYRKWFWEY